MKIGVIVKGNKIIAYQSLEPEIVNGIKAQTGLKPIQDQVLHEMEIEDKIMLQSDHEQIIEQIKSKISYNLN